MESSCPLVVTGQVVSCLRKFVRSEQRADHGASEIVREMRIVGLLTTNRRAVGRTRERSRTREVMLKGKVENEGGE